MRKPIEQRIKEMNAQTMHKMCLHKKYTGQKNLQSKKPKNLRKNLANLKAHICVLYADIII